MMTEVKNNGNCSVEETNLQQGKTFNDEIQRLAALPPLQYDQIRKDVAEKLSVRMSTLDAEVRAARKKDKNDNQLFTEVESWPEPVNPAMLLTEIETTIQRFVQCSKEVAQTVALWIAMTWFIDVIEIAPIAVIIAPEKRCGKTLLLSLIGRLANRPITSSNISSAALFRAIEAWSPTLLIDEADAFLKDNEELRGLINSGHTRNSAYVIRTVGESFTPTKFNTWGAKAIAGIGRLADTIMDRSITLALSRKRPNEKIDRIRNAEQNLFGNLQRKLARFAEDYRDQVCRARPPLPISLNDRAQDNWEPLLAIAMIASNEWLQKATKAALKLSGNESVSQTAGTELLSEIQRIFMGKNVDRISTEELINALCEDHEKPWATFNKGLPITPRQLASKLKEYGIQSKSIRIGNFTPKGFEKEQFADAFSRYLPSLPENIRDTPQFFIDVSLNVADIKQQPQHCRQCATKTPLTKDNDSNELNVADSSNVADAKT